MLIGRKAHEILVILPKEDLGLDYRQREESKRWSALQGTITRNIPRVPMRNAEIQDHL